ncbi:NAD-dependent dihydropyrimidine dehydrogenase PreA subunit [Bradyrhizobium sp. CIR18]|uniref:4Fe-4S dicluster domain-containing protein n=1 Tax=Bradyrhizobium sp. CIR18 TaxID=2663839 RepID=UPI0016069164|nr:ferredoxin family protein [Bradyrhizobium sp. CIR18]MBB4364304.1 NAD-dependent dihydropyrimidine dehydrogenase PreA subunit [Bradyrhizobium sp. CIR18]
MIEVIDTERCTSCDICVTVCPTNVFDKTDGIPVIARQSDCQTCFLCELYCPEDALYVAPFADQAQPVDLLALKNSPTLGSYRRAVGWTDETRDRRGLDRSYLLFGH